MQLDLKKNILNYFSAKKLVTITLDVGCLDDQTTLVSLEYIK